MLRKHDPHVTHLSVLIQGKKMSLPLTIVGRVRTETGEHDDVEIDACSHNTSQRVVFVEVFNHEISGTTCTAVTPSQ